MSCCHLDEAAPIALFMVIVASIVALLAHHVLPNLNGLSTVGVVTVNRGDAPMLEEPGELAQGHGVLACALGHG